MERHMEPLKSVSFHDSEAGTRKKEGLCWQLCPLLLTRGGGWVSWAWEAGGRGSGVVPGPWPGSPAHQGSQQAGHELGLSLLYL